ncbi:hypothetical protein LPTSP3_g33330 [Leptospira kobayashii]|uniref:HTH marR-type domain-containing protein n=1 Tax=Leptospira kobayashii TaxID=1917830 RepID=A0ABM7UMT8_9LEPT|nr:MarR family transcriptional regulator [Leptospira kobayashii]BDA80403.1 hypothetical protein LPTSP3_g33330 [Leptospira kobayashii]
MESVVLLIRAGRIAAAHLEKEITPLMISVPQLSILLSLSEWGEMTASQLCELTMRDKANISSLTKKLEQEGFIHVRKNSEDARSSLLSLTAKGRKTAESGFKAEKKISSKLEKLSQQTKFPREYLSEIAEKINKL